jgi:hypothetical protein
MEKVIYVLAIGKRLCIVVGMELIHNGANPAGVSPASLTNNAVAFLTACSSRKGQFIRLRYKSVPTSTLSASSRKAGVMLEKETEGVFRTGVNYANLSAVKEAIEAEERGEVQPLPKGQTWAVFPWVIKTDKGGELLRITVAEGQFPKVVYKVNGVEVSKENYESHLVASARSKERDEPLLVFTIKSENLLSVSGADLP